MRIVSKTPEEGVVGNLLSSMIVLCTCALTHTHNICTHDAVNELPEEGVVGDLSELHDGVVHAVGQSLSSLSA